MAWKACWAVAMVALLCPVATASEAEGSFAIAGETRFAQGVDLEGAALALLRAVDGEPLAMTDFQLRAGTLRVWHERLEYVHPDNGLPLGGGVEVRKSNSSYVVHNATVTLVREHEGRAHVGLDAMAASALSFYAGHITTLEARNHSVLASGDTSLPSSSRDMDYYYRAIDEEHLLLTGAGRVRLDGSASVKLYGMTVDITADENATRHRLDDAPQPFPYSVTAQRTWLVLEAEDFEIDLSSTGAWQIALANADVRWQGEALFRCIQGQLSTERASYRASPRPIVLDGAFSGTMHPEGKGRGVHSRLDVAGVLSATSMEAASGAVVAREAGGPGFVLPWLALVVGLAASGVGTALVLRRRARPSPRAVAARDGPTAEECVDKAGECIGAESFAEALHWLTLARRLAPTSVSVRATEGFVLAHLGRVDEALEAYQDASRLAPADGEHALVAARLAHESGRPAELIEDLLEVALARDPSQVDELERDGFFAALASRPRFEHMVESAWRRFVGDLSSPGKADG